jgi:hypothetical protein
MHIFYRRTIPFILILWMGGLFSACTSRNDARFSGLSDDVSQSETISVILSGTIGLDSIITRSDVSSAGNIITRSDLQAAGITNPVAIPVPDALNEGSESRLKASVEKKHSSKLALKQASSADISDLSQLAVAVYVVDEGDTIVGQTFSEETGRFSIEIETGQAEVKLALALPLGSVSADQTEFGSTLFLGFVTGADDLDTLDLSQNADGDRIELGLISSNETDEIESSADFSDVLAISDSGDEVVAEDIDDATKIFSLGFAEDASPFIDTESGISVILDEGQIGNELDFRGNLLALTGQEYAYFSPVDYPDFTQGLSDQFTLSAWINVRTWVQTEVESVVSVAAGPYLFLGVEQNSQTLYAQVVPDGSTVGVYPENVAQGTLVLSSETWHHVAATVNLSEDAGVFIEVYVDGSLDQHATCDCDAAGTLLIPFVGQLFTIGAVFQASVATTATFAGYLDDIHMYNVALTPGQILTDYLSGLE